MIIVSDNHFDLPDRTFHSVDTSWRLSSFQSSTDVKELIPEFFFLPEFFLNNEGKFGRFMTTLVLSTLCLSSRGIQPWGGPGIFLTTTVTPVNFHTSVLIPWCSGLLLTPTLKLGGYSKR